MKFLVVIFTSYSFLSFSQSQDDLAVYDYQIIHEENTPTAGFVVLSDMFPFGDFKEDNIIAPENLGEFEYTNDNYHQLKGIYRKRFLNQLKIEESDFLYVNNLSTNKLKTFRVSDLKLTAFLTPYGPDIPIHNWDYLIGFELDSLTLPFSTPEVYGHTIFSCVADKNPFNKGKAQLMKWEKIDSSEFIWEMSEDERPKFMLPPTYKEAYLFKWGKLNFYVREIQGGEFLFGHYLVVADAKTNEKITSMFFFESEGTYLEPLNGQKNAYTDRQFTGYIFKDKPPIIYGFQSNSFGCPYISFASKTQELLWLRCDNRH